MATFISHNADETAALGEEWGRTAQPGWVIGLSGDLGAGKTQLIKGFARGLDIAGRIQSPTFALVNEYQDGRLPFAHIDLYRLDEPRQFYTLGLEEIFEANALVLIEWGEKFARFLPADRIIITIAHGEGDHRRITATGDRLLSRTKP